METKQANPSAIGSLGFGMTTVLYSIVGAGFFEVNSMLLSMAIFLGGSAQLLAGLLSYKKGSTFGFTSYSMFGFYWYTIVALSLLPVLGLSNSPDRVFMGWFFLVWTLFTIMLFLKTLSMNILTKVIFGVVVFLFSTLTLSSLTNWQFFGYLAGYTGIICGLLAMLAAYKNLD